MCQDVTIYIQERTSPFVFGITADDIADDIIERGHDRKSEFNDVIVLSDDAEVNLRMWLSDEELHLRFIVTNNKSFQFISDIHFLVRNDSVVYEAFTDKLGKVYFQVPLKFGMLKIFCQQTQLLQISIEDLRTDDLIGVYVKKIDGTFCLSIPCVALNIPFDGTFEGFCYTLANLPDLEIEIERGKTLKFRDLIKRLKKKGVEVVCEG